MTITIDENKLRNDLKEYYGSGAVIVNPAMFLEVGRAESANAEELYAMAENAGLDTSKYIVDVSYDDD